MKVEVNEYQGCYSIDLTPETLTDVNALVRLKLNAKKEIRNIDTYADSKNGVGTSVVIGRNKSERSYIK